MDFYVGQKVQPTSWEGEYGLRVPQWYRALIGCKVDMIVRQPTSGAILVEIVAKQLPIEKVTHNGREAYLGWVHRKMIKPRPVVKRF